MNLHSRQPSQGADLRELLEATSGRGWEGALPSALPDKLLLELARDFRASESPNAANADGADLASPTLAVLNLLTLHPERSGEPDAPVELSGKALMSALDMYQWAVEREIVSRVVGIGRRNESATLKAALRSAAVGRA